jgi:N-acylglucosamine 2-epimerase
MRHTETSLPDAFYRAPFGLAQLVADFRPQIRAELAASIIPFWQRTLDVKRGGVFNCWNNAGTRLVTTDKFTWSQGRFLWLWSRLADAMRQKLLPGSADEFVTHAEKTFGFLREHAFLPDGRCAFLLTEDGQPKEAVAGGGLAPSIYADCFVTMGFAEFARVTRSAEALEAAWKLFLDIERRIKTGDCPTHPTPIPAGYEAYALAMIFLNVALVVSAACEELGSAKAAAATEWCTAAAGRIFDRFVREDGRIAEFRPIDGPENDTLLCRHLNPGHALEGTWMLLTVAARLERRDWIATTLKAVRFALNVGWDDVHGGLLYYVDRTGGPPRGQDGGSSYEAGLQKNWDAKLWWVHSEAIFASLLAYRLSGDGQDAEWHRRICEYALRVFPNPDREVGEWVQIRNRKGEPVETVVALPVKDPYHIVRNLVQVVELGVQG